MLLSPSLSVTKKLPEECGIEFTTACCTTPTLGGLVFDSASAETSITLALFALAVAFLFSAFTAAAFLAASLAAADFEAALFDADFDALLVVVIFIVFKSF